MASQAFVAVLVVQIRRVVGALAPDDHAGAHRVVGDGVNKDEGAGGPVLLEGVEHQLPVGNDGDAADFVQLQMIGFLPVQGVDVYLVAQFVDAAAGDHGGLLDEVAALGIHGLLAHPDKRRLDVPAYLRQIVGPDQHVPAADVDLVLQRHGDGLLGQGALQVAVHGDDGFHAAPFAGRQGDHFVAFLEDAGGHLAAEAAEIQVRPQDVLHGIAQVHRVVVAADVNVLQQLQQAFALVPGHVLAVSGGHVVAHQRADGHEPEVLDAQFPGEGREFLLDLRENFLAVIHQVHFVDRHDDVGDPHQGRDEKVPFGLRQDAQPGVY